MLTADVTVCVIVGCYTVTIIYITTLLPGCSGKLCETRL